MSIEHCWIKFFEAIYISGVKTNDQEFLNSDFGKALKDFLMDIIYKKEDQYGRPGRGPL